MRPIWSIITEHLWDTFGLDWLCDEHKHATFLHAAVCAFGCSPAQAQDEWRAYQHALRTAIR